MDYNIEIWEDMTYDERQTYKIYQKFRRKCIERGCTTQWLPTVTKKNPPNFDRDGMYPADPIRNHKNWKIFEAVHEKSLELSRFDPYIFIEAIFKDVVKGQRLFPGMLKTKKSFDKYEDYLSAISTIKRTDDDERMMTCIMGSYKVIQSKVGNKPSTNDLYEFFNGGGGDDSIWTVGILCATERMLSLYYLVLSRSFEVAYDNADPDMRAEIIDPEKYQNLRNLLKIKTRVYQFAKKVFGDDII